MVNSRHRTSLLDDSIDVRFRIEERNEIRIFGQRLKLVPDRWTMTRWLSKIVSYHIRWPSWLWSLSFLDSYVSIKEPVHKDSCMARSHSTFLIQSPVHCGRKRSKRSSAFSAIEAPKSRSDESFRDDSKLAQQQGCLTFEIPYYWNP